MSGLAEILLARGVAVVGTDIKIEESDSNNEKFIKVPLDQAGEYMSSADALIYTDAANQDSLVTKAREKGMANYPYHEALAEVCRGFDVVAVAGTHGKSSTTAMLGHILIEAGMDPTVLVGASVKGWIKGGVRIGQGKIFVLEADEYRNHYLSLGPENIIVTNVEFDHPDFFRSFDEVVASYNKFLSKLKGGKVVTHEEVHENQEINWPTETEAVDETLVDAVRDIETEHMKKNAALAVRMAINLGVEKAKAVGALAVYQGLSRRMEALGKVKGMDVFSDYGHHPTEIEATLTGAKKIFPGKKVLAVFEPHTQERLKKMGADFMKALSLAQGVIVAPVFVPGGREINNENKDLINEFFNGLKKEVGHNVWRINNLSELKGMMEEVSDQFDVAIGFSAGDLDSYIRKL
jgi:UDP-N-acetylmuramate--alanine ligase